MVQTPKALSVFVVVAMSHYTFGVCLEELATHHPTAFQAVVLVVSIRGGGSDLETRVRLKLRYLSTCQKHF